MASRRRSSRSRLLLCGVLLTAAASTASATSDENVGGLYEGNCVGVSLTFRFDGNASDIVINGLQKGDAVIDAYGFHGPGVSYSFEVKGSRTLQAVDFAVLLSENDDPLAVTGFYSEYRIVRKGKGEERVLKTSCALRMTRSDTEEQRRERARQSEEEADVPGGQAGSEAAVPAPAK
jgi:hypothetical protein